MFADGLRFTVTLAIPADPVHPLVVAVTEYIPDAAVVALGITGFCEVEAKEFGPLQV